MSTTTTTAIMTSAQDELPPSSSSQLLASSLASLNSSSSSTHHQQKHRRHSSAASSKLARTYRQASTLFLTRRLPESLSTLLPILEPPLPDEDRTINGREVEEPAPIASASQTSRVKVWSLYLTLINAIVELDPAEGKQAFGNSEWRSLVVKVKEGTVWEEVVQNGYGGREVDVDADVVINLATLLLSHAPSQKLNQQLLESYLAASRPVWSPPNDPHASEAVSTTNQVSTTPGNTDTSGSIRDLQTRVKILELYTLHVLLRNDEWDYARDFIRMSDVLDEERREAFLLALQSLRNEKEDMERTQKEEARHAEEVLERRRRERERDREGGARRMRTVVEEEGQMDQRVEPAAGTSSHPNGITRSSAHKPPGPSSSHAKSNPPQRKNTTTQSTLLHRLRILMYNLSHLLSSTTNFSISDWMRASTSMSIMRLLVFVLAFLTLWGKRDARELVVKAWRKVRGTVGMGVRVSYV